MSGDVLAIFDTETSDLDGHVVELAVVRWSVRHSCIVSTWSTLVVHHENAATHVNRIPLEALGHGMLQSMAVDRTSELLLGVDVVLGWHVDFDREHFEKMPGYLGWSSKLSGLRWVDAMLMPWPNTKPYSPLVETALANGIGVVSSHRAIADCLIIARMLERMVELGQDVNAMLERAMQPRKMYQGLQHFNDNRIAKEAGFWFDKPTKRWLRLATASEVAELPFPCREAT